MKVKRIPSVNRGYTRGVLVTFVKNGIQLGEKLNPVVQ